MNTLEMLRQKNPGLKLFCVQDPEFAPYGRVLDVGDPSALAAVLGDTVIPENGNTYCANDESLIAQDAVACIRRAVFGGMPVEAGFCNGHGFTMNAMEYHKCSEVNFSTTGCVLLLALPSQLHDGYLDSNEVVGFYLPPLTAIEVFPLVLHYAPCRTEASGFNCLVVLEKGVNSPINHADAHGTGEEKLLWAVGKWLTAHVDSANAAKGAFPGITGPNWELKI